MKSYKTTNINTHINTCINSNTSVNNSNNEYSHHIETLDNTDLQYINYLRSKQIKRNKWINC